MGWVGRSTVLALLALMTPLLGVVSPVTPGESAVAPPLALTTRTATPPGATPLRRPNIVLILLDDLDARSVDQMPAVASLLRDQGASFASFFVTTPTCCPSRASLLRGQYAHNHGALRNDRPRGGFHAFHRLGREESTVATWLRDAGYRTGLFGKYLNGYPDGVDEAYVPPGWDAWHVPFRRRYFDYYMNENGALTYYGTDPAHYLTDVLAARARDFVAASAAAGAPFFVYLAPRAPHGPATAAPRHAGAFADARAPRVPSFDEADVGDKPAWVRRLPRLGEGEVTELDEWYRQRLRSLLAVDELVAALVETLRAASTLEHTYVFFTSDNGFHLGEHRIPFGKGQPYDEGVRVPLLVRGPGVAAGRVVDGLALNVDLAPTFAELAGVAPPTFVDGRSLAPLLGGRALGAWRRAVLVEYFGGAGEAEDGPARATPAAGGGEGEAGEAGDGPPDDAPYQAGPFRALRTADLYYVKYADGERELYDVRADPYQLDNLATTADPALLARLSARLAELRDCAGAGCRAAEDAPVAFLDDG